MSSIQLSRKNMWLSPPRSPLTAMSIWNQQPQHVLHSLPGELSARSIDNLLFCRYFLPTTIPQHNAQTSCIISLPELSTLAKSNCSLLQDISDDTQGVHIAHSHQQNTVQHQSYHVQLTPQTRSPSQLQTPIRTDTLLKRMAHHRSRKIQQQMYRKQYSSGHPIVHPIIFYNTWRKVPLLSHLLCDRVASIYSDEDQFADKTGTTAKTYTGLTLPTRRYVFIVRVNDGPQSGPFFFRRQACLVKILIGTSSNTL